MAQKRLPMRKARKIPGSVHASAPEDLTGLPPTGSAAWLGVMTGTTLAGEDRGDRLVGTAALNHDMAVGALDATFSGIWSFDRGTGRPVEALILSNLAVGPDGTFGTGQSGNRIQGGFRGPGHVEVAGIFERSGIVGGAPDATRQWTREREPNRCMAARSGALDQESWPILNIRCKT